MIYTRKQEPATVRGVCTVVGCINPQKSAPGGKYRALCSHHYEVAYGQPRKRRGYRGHKKSYCEDCGPTVKYHRCQLDVDHDDGDHSNDDPENLKTRCANCHRLKTFMRREGMYSGR